VTVPDTQTAGPATPVRWADVFAHREYRGLWAAHALSLAGDQLARVALTVLVFDRTGSPAAAAAAYAVTMVPWLVGGPLLGGLGDRYPRRAVLIACDLACAVLVAAMTLPGAGLVVLCALLFAATLVAPAFGAARSALVADLFPDHNRYARATAVTTVTIQAAQVAGFAAGGVLVAALGPRQALAVDAATFVLSAVLVRFSVRARPAAAGAGGRGSAWASLRGGAGLVFGDRRLRALTLLAWLAALHVVPAGVVLPYAADLGGGPAAVGGLLAAVAAGTAAGMIALGRLDTAARARLMYPLAVLAGVPLVACAVHPGLVASAVLWAVSGAGTSYELAANVAFVAAVPAGRRAQAFALVGTGLAAGQGLAIVTAGALAEAIPPHLIIAAAGAAATALAALLAAAARRPRPGSCPVATGPGTLRG
jgi:MFS family permease